MWPGWDLNLGPLDYKSSIIIARPCCLYKNKTIIWLKYHSLGATILLSLGLFCTVTYFSPCGPVSYRRHGIVDL